MTEETGGDPSRSPAGTARVRTATPAGAAAGQPLAARLGGAGAARSLDRLPQP